MAQCPEERPYSYEQSCCTECPQNRPLVDEGICVEECPAERSERNDDNICGNYFFP